MSTKEKGLSLITLTFPAWSHIAAQEENRREQGLHRSWMNESEFLLYIPQKTEQPSQAHSLKVFWIVLSREYLALLWFLRLSTLPVNIYPTKDPLGSCVPSSPEIQSLRIIQILRLNQDSFQRIPCSTLPLWWGLAIKLASNDLPPQLLRIIPPGLLSCSTLPHRQACTEAGVFCGLGATSKFSRYKRSWTFGPHEKEKGFQMRNTLRKCIHQTHLLQRADDTKDSFGETSGFGQGPGA